VTRKSTPLLASAKPQKWRSMWGQTRLRPARSTMKLHRARCDDFLFLSVSDELVGPLLYLITSQRCAMPVDTFAIRVDAINIQRLGS
jgi:hypothetical protein